MMKEMDKKVPPKAILFDIGGVVVISPFQAILDYEQANNIPVGYINFAIQKGPHDTGAWQLIERGECILDDSWFVRFKQQLENSNSWTAFCAREHSRGKIPTPSLPVPDIDTKTLFWNMMNISRRTDPYIYPALKKLRQSGRFVIGALSNTIAFPPNILDNTLTPFSHALIHPPAPHPHANDPTDIRELFDVFISSAHVGVRKPEKAAYEMAVRELDRVAREKGGDGVKAGEVLFLDDIGGNLRGGREAGLRTLKVELGKGREAVRVLEGEVGMGLLEEGEKARL